MKRKKKTDATAATNEMVVGTSPAMATATTYLTQAHSTGLMFAQAVNQQANNFITGNTATTQGVLQTLNVPGPLQKAEEIKKLIEDE